MKPSDFFTRTPANAGAKMPIPDPITGKDSGETLTLRGFDSDAFQAALVAKSRRNAEILTLPEGEQAEALKDAEMMLFLALVAGWSFKEPFTEKALIEFLTECPYIQKAVDDFASKRANFIKRQSKS